MRSHRRTTVHVADWTTASSKMLRTGEHVTLPDKRDIAVIILKMKDYPYYLGGPREVIRILVGGMQESMLLEVKLAARGRLEQREEGITCQGM